MVPGFFESNIEGAHEQRLKPKAEEEFVVIDSRMYEMLKTFRVNRQGNRKGGMHLMR